MTEKELFQTVDSERRKLLKESRTAAILCSLTLTIWLFILYQKVVVYPALPMLWFGLSAANLFATSLLIYASLRQYKFALRLTESLEKGAISGALDLLDFNKKSYKVRKRLVFLGFWLSLAFLLTWIVGASLSWWTWNSTESLLFGILLTLTTAISLTSIPRLRKLEKQDKNRKKVQELMEKCLQQEERPEV